eukprot:gnl/TRDRNA2_/TRDRNA2_176077_c0_seq16.p1 gnl/TRDRNA2_/TRDRNA2_176077_c0~~gnl/TRDRNA2_/TRDRNA2_176077_c0_seq16.p1  ORF type:complete len:950 (-),score=112.98 gnl/TRDRNA2_/TRDRNA2_176077_c0_seq16:5-2854(-)
MSKCLSIFSIARTRHARPNIIRRCHVTIFAYLSLVVTVAGSSDADLTPCEDIRDESVSLIRLTGRSFEERGPKQEADEEDQPADAPAPEGNQDEGDQPGDAPASVKGQERGAKQEADGGDEPADAPSRPEGNQDGGDQPGDSPASAEGQDDLPPPPPPGQAPPLLEDADPTEAEENEANFDGLPAEQDNEEEGQSKNETNKTAGEADKSWFLYGCQEAADSLGGENLEAATACKSVQEDYKDKCQEDWELMTKLVKNKRNMLRMDKGGNVRTRVAGGCGFLKDWTGSIVVQDWKDWLRRNHNMILFDPVGTPILRPVLPAVAANCNDTSYARAVDVANAFVAQASFQGANPQVLARPIVAADVIVCCLFVDPHSAAVVILAMDIPVEAPSTFMCKHKTSNSRNIEVYHWFKVAKDTKDCRDEYDAVKSVWVSKTKPSLNETTEGVGSKSAGINSLGKKFDEAMSSQASLVQLESQGPVPEDEPPPSVPAQAAMLLKPTRADPQASAGPPVAKEPRVDPQASPGIPVADEPPPSDSGQSSVAVPAANMSALGLGMKDQAVFHQEQTDPGKKLPCYFAGWTDETAATRSSPFDNFLDSVDQPDRNSEPRRYQGCPCVFPYQFNQVSYNQCTVTGGATPWCGLTPRVYAGSSTGWTFCTSLCPGWSFTSNGAASQRRAVASTQEMSDEAGLRTELESRMAQEQLQASTSQRLGLPMQEPMTSQDVGVQMQQQGTGQQPGMQGPGVLARMAGAGGSSTNSPCMCHFPFFYEGTEYHTCTMAGRNSLWCGTEREVGKDLKEGWIPCAPSCPGYLYSGMQSFGTTGCSCIFPFVFQGATYNTCTTAAWSSAWCGTSALVLSGTNNGWINCPSTCPQPVNLPGISQRRADSISSAVLAGLTRGERMAVIDRYFMDTQSGLAPGAGGAGSDSTNTQSGSPPDAGGAGTPFSTTEVGR